MVTSKSLQLDFHSLITLLAPDIPDKIREMLISQIGPFVRAISHPSSKIDIRLMQIHEDPILVESSVPMNFLFGFHLSEYLGQKAFVFKHRGRPSIIVLFSEDIKIFFRNRPRIFRKLWLIILFCLRLILITNNGLLMHGAVVQKGDSSILFTGHMGTKKTLLLLTMLRNGWNYLSDDKLILHNNSAFSFQQASIPLHDHHFDFLPWLTNIVPGCKRFRSWSPIRKPIITSAHKHLPQILISPINRFLNPCITLSVDTLFPTCETTHSVKLSDVVLLSIGPEFAMTKLAQKEAIEDITLIQKMGFHMFKPLEYMLILDNKKYRMDIETVIKSNLAGPRFYKLTIPDKYHIDKVYQEVINYISYC